MCMCLVARPVRKRCSTEFCSCKTRFVVPARSRADPLKRSDAMTSRIETLSSRIAERFPEKLKSLPALAGEAAYEVAAADLLQVCRELREDPQFGFEQLMDLAGVDFLDYGRDEWRTFEATETGFSRGVARVR